MDTVTLLQNQIQQLSDIESLIYYCSIVACALMGFGKGSDS